MKQRGVRQRILIDGLVVEDLHTFIMMHMAALDGGVTVRHYKLGDHLVVIERSFEEIDDHSEDDR